MKKMILLCMAVFMVLTGCATKALEDDYNFADMHLTFRQDDEEAFVMNYTVQSMRDEPIEDVKIEVYMYTVEEQEPVLVHTFEFDFMRKEIKRFKVNLLPVMKEKGFDDEKFVEKDRNGVIGHKVIDKYGTREYLPKIRPE